MKQYIFILAIFSFLACQNNHPLKTGHEGDSMPQFSLLLPDSTSYFNTKNLPTGKPVVMFYFSPHCPFCRAQMKEIAANINELKGLQFLVFTYPPFSEMKKFYTEFQLEKYNNIVTGVDTSNFFAGYFQTSQVPYLAIYGKDRKLNHSFLGKTYISQIRKIANEQ